MTSTPHQPATHLAVVRAPPLPCSPSHHCAHLLLTCVAPSCPPPLLQALRELELCLGSGALRGFWSALCALPALERLTLRADKGEPFVLDAQELAALPAVRELALSSFSAVRLVAGGAADGSDASSAGAPTALLPRLERLSVAGSERLELNGPLPALRALYATGCGEVMVGGPALELPSLSDLSVQAHGAVEAWGSRLPALERLELAGVGTLQARDYTRLTRLSHLSLRQLDASTLVADIALSMLRLAPPTLRSLALHFGDYRATEGRIVRRLAPALRGLSQVRVCLCVYVSGGGLGCAGRWRYTCCSPKPTCSGGRPVHVGAGSHG